MSYRPLHVNSFEVDSPDVKYGCALSLALSLSAPPRFRWPLARRRLTASHAPPARSDEYIESTYQYHSTHVIEENGKVVRGRPALSPQGRIVYRKGESSTGKLGRPPDCGRGGPSGRW